VLLGWKKIDHLKITGKPSDSAFLGKGGTKPNSRDCPHSVEEGATVNTLGFHIRSPLLGARGESPPSKRGGPNLKGSASGRPYVLSEEGALAERQASQKQRGGGRGRDIFHLRDLTAGEESSRKKPSLWKSRVFSWVTKGRGGWGGSFKKPRGQVWKN